MPTYIYKTVDLTTKITLNDRGDLLITRERDGDTVDSIRFDKLARWLWDEIRDYWSCPDRMDSAFEPNTEANLQVHEEARAADLVHDLFLRAYYAGKDGAPLGEE